MKKQELINEAQKSLQDVELTINKIPQEIDDLDVISSVSMGYIYLNTVDTFKEHTDLLHVFAKHLGTYECMYYGISCGALSMRYTFKDQSLEVYFYCREIEKALEVIGKGKCKVVEEYTTPYKRQTVVCDA